MLAGLERAQWVGVLTALVEDFVDLCRGSDPQWSGGSKLPGTPIPDRVLDKDFLG